MLSYFYFSCPSHSALSLKPVAPSESSSSGLNSANTIAGKRVAFEQLEAQLYEELQSIISESGVLHTALDRALKLEIECFQRALAPISSTTCAPLTL